MVSASNIGPMHELPSSVLATELVAVLPFALAAAPDAGVMDSLLAVYGSALRETAACEEAVSTFESLKRRTHDRKLLDRAKEGLAVCGLQLGLEALNAHDRFAAERWFATAISADSTGPAGRRALLELGDIRRAQGDFLGAAMAYQSVVAMTANDSLGRAAREKLDVIGAAVPDTTQ
jgi:lipopolysaccharide biosynthesis regulator YciM